MHFSRASSNRSAARLGFESGTRGTPHELLTPRAFRCGASSAAWFILLISGALSYTRVLDGIRAGRVVAIAEADRWLEMRIGRARLGDTIDMLTGTACP
jgi:hypothetical protein